MTGIVETLPDYSMATAVYLLGNAELPVLADAPGRYVMEK
jgi:hypothetical protein